MINLQWPGGVALRDYPHAVDVQVRELPRAKWTQHSPFIGLLRDVAVDHLRVDWQSACCRDSYATAKVQAGVLPVWVLSEFVKKYVAFLTVENHD